MVASLRVLAVFSVIGGYIGIQNGYAKVFEPESAMEASGLVAQVLAPFNESPLGASFSLCAFFFGLSMPLMRLYSQTLPSDPRCRKSWVGSLTICATGFYFDERT